MNSIFNEIPIEEYHAVMREISEHNTLIDCCELIHKHGLKKVLLSLSDYCEDSKEAYALILLSEYYQEKESAICKDAPPMQ